MAAPSTSKSTSRRAPGTPVYAVAAGKVSFGLPSDVAQNGGIVVVEAQGRNFGYWRVAPAVAAGARLPLHALLGHVSDRPEDWGHVHFAESTRGQDGITYWNPLRSGALSPFHDYGPRVIDAIITSLPPALLRGLVDLSVKAHDNTPIAITQPQPPGWHGLPVTPLGSAGASATGHRPSFHGRPQSSTEAHCTPLSAATRRPTSTSRPSMRPTPHKTPPALPARTTSGSNADSTLD